MSYTLMFEKMSPFVLGPNKMWNRKGGKEKCPVDTFPDAACRFHLGPNKDVD